MSFRFNAIDICIYLNSQTILQHHGNHFDEICYSKNIIMVILNLCIRRFAPKCHGASWFLQYFAAPNPSSARCTINFYGDPEENIPHHLGAWGLNLREKGWDWQLDKPGDWLVAVETTKKTKNKTTMWWFNSSEKNISQLGNLPQTSNQCKEDAMQKKICVSRGS